MKNSTTDIVYIYKQDLNDSEELKFSIRSVVQNWDYRKIWIIGDCPQWLDKNKIGVLGYNRHFGNKYQDVNNKLLEACDCLDISDNFWFFNDDFFIMKKINSEKYKVYSDGTLENKLLSVTIKNPTDKAYIEGFEDLLEEFPNGISYETHTPMLFNKKQLKELLIKYPQSPCRRSLYGNYYGVEAETRKDCKIYKLTEKFNQKEPILSTTNIAFFGNSGKIIKSMFKEKTIYEY